MAKDLFVEMAFRGKTRVTIDRVNKIIGEYAARGQQLTVRQIFYQFVTREFGPNTQRFYKSLAETIDNARKAGLIDWAAIHDRTRFLRATPTFTDGSDFLQRGGAWWYYEALWRNQDTYFEVWPEKDAIIGTVEGVCEELRVPYFSCRGYVSSSEMYDAAQRMRRKLRQGKRVIVLDIHDHDPSGLNMTEVIAEWLGTYARSSRIEVKRVALNMDQIEQYDPPPNPAKETDSRFEGYRREFGDESWELDALDPTVLADLIRDAVMPHIDQDQWAVDLQEEAEERERVRFVGEHFDAAYNHLRDENPDYEPPTSDDEE